MAVTPIKLHKPTAVATVIAAAALQSLANGAEAEGTLDNSTGLDIWCDLILAVQYNAGPPVAGVKVAEIYLLPQVDGANYPSITSEGLPQKSLLVAALESVAPSTSVLEYLVATGIQLFPGNNKFRISNTSGQAFHASASMFLKIQPYQLGAGS